MILSLLRTNTIVNETSQLIFVQKETSTTDAITQTQEENTTTSDWEPTTPGNPSLSIFEMLRNVAIPISIIVGCILGYKCCKRYGKKLENMENARLLAMTPYERDRYYRNQEAMGRLDQQRREKDERRNAAKEAKRAEQYRRDDAFRRRMEEEHAERHLQRMCQL